MDWKTVVVLDRCETRRQAIYRALRPVTAVIPVESLGELGAQWPASVWFLVHDEPALMEELEKGFSARRTFHPIVAYSTSLSPGRVVEAIYRGAVNYLQWPTDAASILTALESVADLARRRCQHSAARLVAQDRLAALSARERDVVKAVAAGLTSKEIGRDLGISHRTVEIHRANALAKLAARNTAEAARLLADAEDPLRPTG